MVVAYVRKSVLKSECGRRSLLCSGHGISSETSGYIYAVASSAYHSYMHIRRQVRAVQAAQQIVVPVVRPVPPSLAALELEA